MPSKLSNLINNLSKNYNQECKSCIEGKKLGRNVNLLDLKMTD